MIPISYELSEKEKNLFSFLLFWVMYSFTIHDDGEVYKSKKQECVDHYSKMMLDNIEMKVLNSKQLNRFLVDRGISSNFLR